MYQAYWGLVDSPFRGHHDPRYFHQGPTQEEALARLNFLVDEQRTLGLLLGPSGSGKTFLFETFARALGQINRQTAIVSLVAGSLNELLWSLVGQLGIDLPSNAGTFALSRALADHVVANRYQRIGTIFLLDDADEARPEVLNEVVRWTQLDNTPESRLTLVLAAQPHRVNKLGNRLLELSELRIDLDGWDLEDTAAFVKNTLSAAGRSTPLFSEAALLRLHELAGGIPRRVKQLADLSLLAGAGQNLSQVDGDTIESVCSELGVVKLSTPFAASRWQ